MIPFFILVIYIMAGLVIELLNFNLSTRFWRLFGVGAVLISAWTVLDWIVTLFC